MARNCGKQQLDPSLGKPAKVQRPKNNGQTIGPAQEQHVEQQQPRRELKSLDEEIHDLFTAKGRAQDLETRINDMRAASLDTRQLETDLAAAHADMRLAVLGAVELMQIELEPHWQLTQERMDLMLKKNPMDPADIRTLVDDVKQAIETTKYARGNETGIQMAQVPDKTLEDLFRAIPTVPQVFEVVFKDMMPSSQARRQKTVGDIKAETTEKFHPYGQDLTQSRASVKTAEESERLNAVTEKSDAWVSGPSGTVILQNTAVMKARDKNNNVIIAGTLSPDDTDRDFLKKVQAKPGENLDQWIRRIKVDGKNNMIFIDKGHNAPEEVIMKLKAAKIRIIGSCDDVQTCIHANGMRVEDVKIGTKTVNELFDKPEYQFLRGLPPEKRNALAQKLVKETKGDFVRIRDILDKIKNKNGDEPLSYAALKKLLRDRTINNQSEVEWTRFKKRKEKERLVQIDATKIQNLRDEFKRQATQKKELMQKLAVKWPMMTVPFQERYATAIYDLASVSTNPLTNEKKTVDEIIAEVETKLRDNSIEHVHTETKIDEVLRAMGAPLSKDLPIPDSGDLRGFLSPDETTQYLRTLPKSLDDLSHPLPVTFENPIIGEIKESDGLTLADLDVLNTIKSENSITFKSAQHYLQALKFIPANTPKQQKALLAIINAETASDAALLSYSEANIEHIHPKWNRGAAMKSVLKAQYKNDPALMRELLETGDRNLVYHSLDPELGDGLDGAGQNLIGDVLMEIRAEEFNRNAGRPGVPSSKSPGVAREARLININVTVEYSVAGPMNVITANYDETAIRKEALEQLSKNPILMKDLLDSEPDEHGNIVDHTLKDHVEFGQEKNVLGKILGQIRREEIARRQAGKERFSGI